ncbi:MAG TPA: inositol monophosphatase [Rhodobacterales bacterium]|nr:inositol monophosphatase [Rhodobacterales bacterium]
MKRQAAVVRWGEGERHERSPVGYTPPHYPYADRPQGLRGLRLCSGRALWAERGQKMIDASLEAGLVEAVREAARAEILPRFRNLSPGDIATKSGPDDLVTEADHTAERALAAAVARLMPQALFVGEEACHDDPALLERLATAELAVIVDPVDGTGNFAAGLALFGVILAVVAQGQTVFGLLYDPVMDDWVLARRGGGAWFCKPDAAPRRLTGRPARPSAQAQGFVPLFLYPPERRREIALAMADMGRVGSLRCSCHEYRQVVLGQADFVTSPHTKPWDHAAGCLAVEEAGGKVLAGGAVGYDPRAPRGPILAVADANGPDDLLPPALHRPIHRP